MKRLPCVLVPFVALFALTVTASAVTDGWAQHLSLRWDVGFVSDAVYVGRTGLLATIGEDRAAPGGWVVRLWNPATGQEKLTIASDLRRCRWLAVSVDGRRLASSGAKATTVWDTDTGAELVTVPAAPWHRGGLALNANGTRLVTRIGRGILLVWDVDTGQRIRRFLGDAKKGSVAISATGRAVASAGGPSGTVRVWDVKSGKETGQYGSAGSAVQALLFMSDGEHLATGDDAGVLRIHKLNGDSVSREVYRHDGAVRSLALSGDGVLLASGSDDGSAVSVVWSKGTLTRRYIHAAAGRASKRQPVRRVSLRGRGGRMATLGRDVRVWRLDVRGPAPLPIDRDPSLSSIQTNVHGTRTLTKFRDGHAMLWDTAEGKWLWSLPRSSDRTTVSSFSEDGDSLLVIGAGGSGVRLNTADASARAFDTGPTVGWSMAWTPDLRIVATLDSPDTIALTDTETGTRLQTYTTHGQRIRFVALSRSGRVPAAETGGQLWVWDSASQRALTRLGQERQRPGSAPLVIPLYITDDGAMLLTTSHAGLTLWDVGEGEAVQTMPLGERFETGRILRAASGMSFAVLSADGDGYLWSAAKPRTIQRVLVPNWGAVAVTAEGSLITSFDPSQEDIDVLAHADDYGGISHATGSDVSADGSTLVQTSGARSFAVWHRLAETQ